MTRRFPKELREDHGATARTWSALWEVFRLRFGLRPNTQLDDVYAAALLRWSLTPDGNMEWRRLRVTTAITPPPPPMPGNDTYPWSI